MRRYLAMPLAAVLIVAGPQRALAAQAASPPTEEAAELMTSGGPVRGTILVPRGAGPFPVALVIAGSGPTDRNGNSAALPGANNSLKYLAEGLAARGVASLRYDKRGIAQSASTAIREQDLRFDTYVDDASAWVGRLRADPRFSDVFIVGHSEGSLIGIITARRVAIDGLVSIAGIAQPAGQVLRDQLRPQLPADLWQASERILQRLEGGMTADSIPPALAALYRPSVQPYLISYLAIDPAMEIRRLTGPVLIAQGTTDIQSSVAQAEALKAARPDAELLIIPGMNHVLKAVPADMTRQQASYSDPALPVSPELVDAVSQFILKTSGLQRPN